MLFVDVKRTYEKKIGKTVYVVTSEPNPNAKDDICKGFYRLITRDIESVELQPAEE